MSKILKLSFLLICLFASGLVALGQGTVSGAIWRTCGSLKTYARAGAAAASSISAQAHVSHTTDIPLALLSNWNALKLVR